MKKVKYILIGLFLVIFTPTITFAATPKMQCTYTGSIPDVDFADIGIRVTITLDANNSLSFSSPVLTTAVATDVEGCRQGDLVSDCFKVMSGNEFKIDYVNAVEIKNGYYSLITDKNNYTNHFVQNDKYTCPDNLTMLKQETAGNYTYSFFLTPNTFTPSNCQNNEIDDFSCYSSSTLTRTGPKVETEYDGELIGTKPSSGSCCVYKYNLTTIYTSKFNSATGSTSYAVCAGNNCMTSEPNLSTTASYMSPSDNSEWSKYQNMDNCNNMPSSIWFSNVGGRKVYFPYHASSSETNGNTVFEATLQPNEYCESTIYSSTGTTGGSNNSDSEIDFGDQVEVNCEGIIGQEMLDFLNKIFRWIQILAPIFVIIISSVDFAGAILQDDKDAMKKATSKFTKRLIIAVALFFIPLILSWLLNMFNDITGAASSTCGIGE